MPSLTDIIQQFDNAAANIKKAGRMWTMLRKHLSSAMSNHASEKDHEQYNLLALDFERVRKGLPKLNGEELPNLLMRYTDVFQEHMDAQESGEMSAIIGVSERVYAQGDAVASYSHRLKAARRELVRTHYEDILSQVRNLLAALNKEHEGKREATDVKGERWESLSGHFKLLDRMLGDAVKRPERWGDLFRHLSFGFKQDLDDIIRMDFPPVIDQLPALLSNESDPLPRDLEDLGTITAKPLPVQPVSLPLRWEALSAELFERLCSDIFASTPGWKNPKWLTHTNAPDQGRDIEVEKVDEDALTGTTIRRTIVQCRHRPKGSVKVDDIRDLLVQMELHGRTDLLLVATSGKFVGQVLTFVEKHNQKDRLPVIVLWNDWNLERILAKRPDLTAQYKLS